MWPANPGPIGRSPPNKAQWTKHAPLTTQLFSPFTNGGFRVTASALSLKSKTSPPASPQNLIHNSAPAQFITLSYSSSQQAKDRCLQLLHLCALSEKAINMLRSSRSDLRIDLSASKLTKPFYTTLDEITGRIIYAPTSPVTISDVTIDFVGIARTWVDPSTPGSPRKRANGLVDSLDSRILSKSLD